MSNDATPRPTVLPRTGITLNSARATLSALHFSKESLTKGEREILSIAEGLHAILDDEAPGRSRY